MSEEHKRKISEATKGRAHSKETRRKMSESQKGNRGYWLGKKHTEASKQKMRGRHFSDEHRQRLSEAKKGKKPSLEARQKHSKSISGWGNHKYRKRIKGEWMYVLSLALYWDLIYAHPMKQRAKFFEQDIAIIQDSVLVSRAIAFGDFPVLARAESHVTLTSAIFKISRAFRL